jgi:hypothetical protein
MNKANSTGDLGPDLQIAVPPGEPLQIVLSWPASEDEATWHAAGLRQFELAYSAEDSICEQPIDDPAGR